MTKDILDEIIMESRAYTQYGGVATYIPELACADGARLGICVADTGGRVLESGDSRIKFTIQSISKVFIFSAALMESGIGEVCKKVSIEPTASSFNSIVNLEMKNYHKPLNPMINAGAIACLTMAPGRTCHEKFEEVLELARRASGNMDIEIDENVYLSEKATGSRNRALAYYMLSTGIIDADVEDLLDSYFRLCAIKMDCRDLANAALTFANNGFELRSGKQIFSDAIARMVKATITMCGMYDESGYVAVEVGLPSKSGVGGGILSVVPNSMGIGVYGPSLNGKGSSVGGLEALKSLSRRLDLSIF